MGKKNKKKGSFWKEAHIKAADPVVEEEFPALGSTHVHQQPASVWVSSPSDVPALGTVVTDPAGKGKSK